VRVVGNQSSVRQVRSSTNAVGTTEAAVVVESTVKAFVSSFPTDHVTAAWPPTRAALLLRLAGVWRPRAGLREGGVNDSESGLELGFCFAAVQVGYWLGWASIVVVLAGLALDVGARHRWLLVGSTLAAAVGNTVAMVIPWREWLGARRGRVLLDLWCGGLIAFVALLVVTGGSNFALLLFLAVPFIAVVQIGWRRGFWLAVVTGTCSVVAVLIPLSAGATAMRLALVAAAVAVALVLVRTIRREAAAHKRAAARAELARTLAQEANHRIKNDLQTAADLLLLGRPHGTDGAAFDETAGRIRSIAMVHRLLTEAEDRVDGAALLRSITAGAPVPVTVEAEPRAFDAATAQKLGLVANELVTNAFRHGAPPIVVRLSGGALTRLCVDDRGGGVERATGFGLDLVRRMVEQGLDGRFELRARAGGGTCAEVVFPTMPQ
jgi:two-component sensor histidine kinase